MTSQEFRSLTLSFPGVEDRAHFDRTAFKIIGGRTFATLHDAMRSANIALSPELQLEFCALAATGIYPVANKWGRRGWTTFELDLVPQDVLQAALEVAYEAVLRG